MTFVYFLDETILSPTSYLPSAVHHIVRSVTMAMFIGSHHPRYHLLPTRSRSAKRCILAVYSSGIPAFKSDVGCLQGMALLTV